MSQLELNIRFSFAHDWFYAANPSASIFELDEINAEVNRCTSFEELSDQTKLFLLTMEVAAFRSGVTPEWYQEPVEEIPEDAPYTPEELSMMKNWDIK